MEYEGDRPVRVDTVVISTQHREDVQMDRLRADVMDKVIRAVIPAALLDEHTKYFINPTGRFVIGGPQGDSGLTGRKIIVDTYGGYARHGGGAFSGKDPMVDTFGTGVAGDDKIEAAVEKVFDLTPAAIIRDLDLRKPIYRRLAAYGHMGREDLGVRWENTDRTQALKDALAGL